ncbi:hypothetical protein K456DRAFT_45459 [Colletotrichum gloeosporioides 23]|nr:hypothetical protein K456DRAFT_45459 [Colletotrichum gloeosporioides 23]
MGGEGKQRWDEPNFDSLKGMCSRYGTAGGNAAGDEGAVSMVSCAISRIAGLQAATCPKVVDIAPVLLRE